MLNIKQHSKKNQGKQNINLKQKGGGGLALLNETLLWIKQLKQIDFYS